MAVLAQLCAPDPEHLLTHLPKLVLHLQDHLAQVAAEDQLLPQAQPVDGDGGGVGVSM